VLKLKNWTFYWLPPALWMGMIFFASSDTRSAQHSSSVFVPLMHWLFPTLSPEHIDTIHYLFRKVCHLTEYALLALLLWRAIHYPHHPLATPKSNDGRLAVPKRSAGGWLWPEAGLALALVLLYSASDELHQVFVPTRTALVSDVLIDTGGGAIGLLLLWGIGKLFKRW
jgi:VanZ family protein